jgi:CheY-like chemotaxis protein
LNALLDISRLESGGVEPKYTVVPLATVFAELQRELGSMAEAKGLGLTFAPSTLAISTDHMLFVQLLQNLVGNAVKYTERGSVTVDCAMEGDALIVSIEDTGIGIPADKVEHIFDEYYQVDTHGTQRLGVGLGLAIVREVARLLGYSVNVSSKLGEGTRIKIRIPPQRVVSSVPGANTREPELAPAAGTQPKCRLLLLEDNDSVRTATELFLTLEGYDTQSAGSLEEAEPLLEAMQDGDVLIADYHLESKITGLEVLRQLRARKRRDVPAILLSGDLQSMLRVLKTEVPNCRFLSKPVDTKALLAAIAELGGAAS